MKKGEFDKLKTGDTVYSVSPLSSVCYKAYVLSKGTDTISYIVNGVVFRAKYPHVFTSEEKARQEAEIIINCNYGDDYYPEVNKTA